MSADNLDVLDKAVDKSQAWLMAGSAETGGEKAAPWQPIDSAPKTGEHVLVMDEGCTFGLCGGKMQPWYAIVHYWGHPGEEGFYLTHGDHGNSIYFTHWQPIDPPNFPRTSQNQTVSIGVDGAHEGTTVDKSDSREPEKLYRCKNSDNLHAVMGVPCPDCKLEPEKLNNAQKAHFVSQFPEAIHKYDSRCDQCNAELDGWIPCAKCDIAVCSHKCLDAHKCPAVALAESSLSQNADSSTPCSPAPLSTQPDTRTEKI